MLYITSAYELFWVSFFAMVIIQIDDNVIYISDDEINNLLKKKLFLIYMTHENSSN